MSGPSRLRPGDPLVLVYQGARPISGLPRIERFAGEVAEATPDGRSGAVRLLETGDLIAVGRSGPPWARRWRVTEPRAPFTIEWPGGR